MKVRSTYCSLKKRRWPAWKIGRRWIIQQTGEWLTTFPSRNYSQKSKRFLEGKPAIEELRLLP